MTDDLRTLHSKADALLSRLAARGLEDLAGAAYPTPTMEAPVSGGGNSSPTEAGMLQLEWARDHQAITRGFQQVVSLLERLEERLTPEATGEQCPTWARDVDGAVVECRGTVTHRGRCERCDQWLSKPQNRGFTPDAGLIRQWNGQQVRMCGCGPDCCPQDVQGHTSCRDRAAEGRTVSERCKKRMQRAPTN